MTKARSTTLRITLTAVFMALNIIMSSFGIPVPGGHLYLCDAVICLASILLNPFEAFGIIFGRYAFLPSSNVRISCYAWSSSRCDLTDLA